MEDDQELRHARRLHRHRDRTAGVRVPRRPDPGPVVFVNEESGKAALWRRLDALCRGRAIDPEELRGRLFVAPNAGIKLDDEEWHARLIDLGQRIKPRLFVFDPLARMKAAARKENAQEDMAEVVEFLRTLRHESGSAVGFVHHTGHQGPHMRGSSDLETVWETRLHWKREGQASVVTVESEHREAEAAPPFQYRIAWDGLTRSMRFELIEDELTQSVRAFLEEHPDASGNEVVKVLGHRAKVLALVKSLREGGTDSPVPPDTTSAEPKAGSGTPGAPFRGPGTTPMASPAEPVPLGQYHPSENGRLRVGDDGFLEQLFAALTAGHVTEREWREADRAHRFVVARRRAA